MPGIAYCEDLYPWVKYVVTPLTCGYTWLTMWLLLSRVITRHAYLVTPPWTPLLLSPIVPLLSTCSLYKHVSFRAHMSFRAHALLCHLLLCIAHSPLCTYHCAFTIVYLLLFIFFYFLIGQVLPPVHYWLGRILKSL